MSKISRIVLIFGACLGLGLEDAGIAQNTVSFVVNSVEDKDSSCASGEVCTLRGAIVAANTVPASPENVYIVFDIVGEGPHVIVPTNFFPPITRGGVKIDATTQPGSSCGDPVRGVSPVRMIRIENGTDNSKIDLTLSSDHNTIRGLSLGIFSFQETNHDVEIAGSHNTIECNTFTGAVYAVHIVAGSKNMVQHNVYHGTESGIVMEAGATRNIVRANLAGGNFSGPVVPGNAGVCAGGEQYGRFCKSDEDCPNSLCSTYGNGWAVILDGGSLNTIGGDRVEDRNAFTGPSNGVWIKNGATENVVTKNFFGLEADGVTVVRRLQDPIIVEAPNNTIADNLIAGNQLNGVQLTGLAASGNVIIHNTIVNNGQGVLVDNAPNNIIVQNRIGGSWSNGIQIYGALASGNVVKGNIIGADPDRGILANGQQGILIFEAPTNTIGGKGDAGNILVENVWDGVGITGIGAVGNVVRGNMIGMTNFGIARGNGGNGIRVSNGASSTTVGGLKKWQGNIVAYNRSGGIMVDHNTTSTALLRNIVMDNGGHTGIMSPVSFPVEVATTVHSGVVLSGWLNGAPEGRYRLEVFSSAAGTSRSVQGEQLVRVGVIRGPTFNLRLPDEVIGRTITATVSRKLSRYQYETSGYEFSLVVPSE